jgi:DNA-binding response OmpR family regulator
MKYPLVVVCDRNRRLVDLLRRHDPDPPWLLQHVTDPADCQAALQAPSQGVVVLALAENPLPGLDLLLRLQRSRPQVRRVVVLNSRESEVEALCWDSGATLVLEWGERAALPGVLRRLIR